MAAGECWVGVLLSAGLMHAAGLTHACMAQPHNPWGARHDPALPYTAIPDTCSWC